VFIDDEEEFDLVEFIKAYEIEKNIKSELSSQITFKMLKLQ
jgi:hypothetical protein